MAGPFSGTAGSVVYNAGGTPSVTGISEWSFDLARNTVDASAWGDDFDVMLVSNGNATGSFSGNADSGTVQTALQDALLNGTTVSLTLHVDGSNYWTVGTAVITGQSDSISRTGKGDRSFDFTVSGKPTWTGS